MSEEKPYSEWMTYDKLVQLVKPGDLIEIQRLNLYFKVICHRAVAIESVLNDQKVVDYFVVNLTDDSIVHRELLSNITFGKNCRINNAFDLKYKPFSHEEIIRRAITSVGESKKSYNLTEYNCEHFATHCGNGQANSYQVLLNLILEISLEEV